MPTCVIQILSVGNNFKGTKIQINDWHTYKNVIAYIILHYYLSISAMCLSKINKRLKIPNR